MDVFSIVVLKETSVTIIMSSRTARFVERNVSESSETVDSLISMESFLSQVPDGIDFTEALMYAGVDPDYVIKKAQPVVKRAAENGVLKKLNITEEEALIIAGYTVEGAPGTVSMYERLVTK